MGAFVLTGFMLVMGVYLFYATDSTIDYSIVTNLIRTNATYVEEIDCEKIDLTINLLQITVSPTQQDEVKELLIEMENLHELKRCGKK